MTNKEKIQKIWEYQLDNYVHELTCGKNDCGNALMPQELDGEIILRCSRQSCDYIQKYIPEVVLRVNLKNNFISKLDYFIKRARLFPGCFTQDELQKAEQLINKAKKTKKDCEICKTICAFLKDKEIAHTGFCRQHARYLIFRDREE